LAVVGEEELGKAVMFLLAAWLGPDNLPGFSKRLATHGTKQELAATTGGTAVFIGMFFRMIYEARNLAHGTGGRRNTIPTSSGWLANP
jgi:hypothetical protein